MSAVIMYKIGTNGFHVGAENVRFIAAGSRCRQNLKSEKGASTSPKQKFRFQTSSPSASFVLKLPINFKPLNSFCSNITGPYIYDCSTSRAYKYSFNKAALADLFAR